MLRLPPLRHPPSPFSSRMLFFLILITALGTIPRVWYLYDRPFIDDEIGTLIHIDKSVSYLLSHFTTWLTMNYFILLEKCMAYIFGRGQLSLAAIPLLAGISTIPLTAILAARLTTSTASLISAAFIAFNPFLISYSTIIRSYSLLTALTLLTLTLFFQWTTHRTYKYGCFTGMCCYFLVLFHPNGVYPIICLLFLLVLDYINSRHRKEYFNEIFTILFPFLVSAIFLSISYYKIYQEMLREAIPFHDSSPTSISYLPYVFSQYFSGGFYALLSGSMFVTAIFMAYKYEKPLLWLLPCIFLPILLVSIQGLSVFPWAYARYLIFILPLIVIFMAEGTSFYAERFFLRSKPLTTIIIMLLMIFSWSPQLLNNFKEKSDFLWNHAAEFIKEHYSEDNIILGSTWGEKFQLYPYFTGGEFRIVVLESETLRKFDFAGERKIFFLSSECRIETHKPTYKFGKIQVIIYEKNGERSFLEEIRDDLLRTVDGGKAIAPEFASIYKNIWELNIRLGLIDENFYYYSLWIKSFELTERQRNMPFKFQLWESRGFLETLKNTLKADGSGYR